MRIEPILPIEIIFCHTKSFTPQNQECAHTELGTPNKNYITVM